MAEVGLIERLGAGIPARQPGFERVVGGLTSDERKALMRAAANPSWSDRDLVRILQDEGIIVGEAAFAAWRGVARAQVQRDRLVTDVVPVPVDVVTQTEPVL